jgi:hypothetical protein
VEGMTGKNGKPFDACIQVNADKRGIEFRFDSDRKREQSQKNEQGQPQNGEVWIPKSLLGIELSDKRQDDLKSGQTVYVAGMKDPEGNDFDAYIQVNTGKSKLDFFKHNPDKVQKTGEAPNKTDDILKKNQAQPVEKQSVMKKPRGFKV